MKRDYGRIEGIDQLGKLREQPEIWEEKLNTEWLLMVESMRFVGLQADCV